MLEEYVDGIELNGILVVRDGEPTLVTLSDRLRPPGLGFGVGWIHLTPRRSTTAVLGPTRATVAFAAVRALGLRDGIAFPQLIADGGDVRLGRDRRAHRGGSDGRPRALRDGHRVVRRRDRAGAGSPVARRVSSPRRRNAADRDPVPHREPGRAAARNGHGDRGARRGALVARRSRCGPLLRRRRDDHTGAGRRGPPRLCRRDGESADAALDACRRRGAQARRAHDPAAARVPASPGPRPRRGSRAAAVAAAVALVAL